MKKITSILSLLLVSASCGSAWAQSATPDAPTIVKDNFYDKTGWTVKASSFAGSKESGEGNGIAEAIIDGSESTYWHSDYNNGVSVSGPHYFIIDMKSSRKIGSFRFSYRNENKNQNGQVKGYKFYVGSLENNLQLVKEGELQWSDSHQVVIDLDHQVEGQFVKFEITSAHNGQQFANCAEFDVSSKISYKTEYQSLSRAGWVVEAESWHSDGVENGRPNNGKAEMVLDGRMDTYWHSNYDNNGTGPSKKLPIWITIDMQKPVTFSSFGYCPRPYAHGENNTVNTRDTNGVIKDYKFEVSNDNVHWTLVKNGVLDLQADAPRMFWEDLDAVCTARYVRFTAKNTYFNGGKFATMAEFYLGNTLIDTDKYYRLRNSSYNRYLGINPNAIIEKPNAQPEEKNKVVVTENLDLSNASYIWKFDAVNDVQRRYYLHGQGENSTALTQSNDLFMTKEGQDNQKVAGYLCQCGDNVYSWGTTGETLNEKSNTFIHESSSQGHSVVGWNTTENPTHWVLEPAESIDFTVGNGGWSSLFFEFPVELPTGMTAYKVQEENETELRLSAIAEKVLPARTPVFVTGTENTKYTLNIVASNHDKAMETGLKGILLDKAPATVDCTIYGIATKNAKTALYKYSGEGKFHANRAYYSVAGGAAPATKSVYVGNENITGVEENVLDTNVSGEYYDLNGRRVLYPTRGIYVTKSGQKVFIK